MILILKSLKKAPVPFVLITTAIIGGTIYGCSYTRNNNNPLSSIAPTTTPYQTLGNRILQTPKPDSVESEQAPPTTPMPTQSRPLNHSNNVPAEDYFEGYYNYYPLRYNPYLRKGWHEFVGYGDTVEFSYPTDWIFKSSVNSNQEVFYTFYDTTNKPTITIYKPRLAKTSEITPMAVVKYHTKHAEVYEINSKLLFMYGNTFQFTFEMKNWKNTQDYTLESLIDSVSFPNASTIDKSNWRTYNSPNGYTIKYPENLKFVDGKNMHFDFQLKDSDVLITFVVTGFARDRSPIEYLMPGFCHINPIDMHHYVANNVAIYQGERLYDDNNTCLNAVALLKGNQLSPDNNWVVDIQGKAESKSAITTFNAIVQTINEL
jgi:hypothetical protein